MRPPWLPSRILCAIGGDEPAGDLIEEYGLVCRERGPAAAGLWYTSQVLRSAIPFLTLRVRTGEFAEALARSIAGILVPVLLLDRLWTFAYSQIPLKDGVARSPELLAVNLACAALGAGLFRPSPALASLAAAAALWTSVSAAPLWYAASAMAAAPAAAMLCRKWSLR